MKLRLAMVQLEDGPVMGIEHDGALYRRDPQFGGSASILEAIVGATLPSLEADLSAPLPADAPLLSPFPHPPRNIICLGKNYAAHAEEFGRNVDGDLNAPSNPIVFTKATTTAAGPSDTIVVDPRVTAEVDYEVELGVVIGEGGRFIPAEEATRHIAGYIVINDLTARDLQRSHQQFFLGKSLDGFCPMGPVFVTADEIDSTNVDLGSDVDGELRQRGNTKDMIFDIPTIIAVLSSVMTLQPGDIIATGTPEGVAVGFTPPRYLQNGSVVEAWVEGIGTLRNTIRFAATGDDASASSESGSGQQTNFVSD